MKAPAGPSWNMGVAQSTHKKCNTHVTLCRAANATLTPEDASAQALGMLQAVHSRFLPSGIGGSCLTNMQLLLVGLKNSQLACVRSINHIQLTFLHHTLSRMLPLAMPRG